MAYADDLEYYKLLRAHLSKLPLWIPDAKNPNQVLAYHIDCDEIFYGGAAGGGKTEILIGKGVTQGYRSIIYRREFPQAASIIDRLTNILKPVGGQINSNKYEYKTPDGRMIRIRSVEHEKDKEKHAGNPYDKILFDEITQFPESVYIYLTTWNRSTNPNARCQVIAAGNPPTSTNGIWVKKRWAAWLDKNHPNPAKSGEVRFYATIDGKDVECPDKTPIERDGQIYYPKSRTFIKSLASDNSFLGTNYIATLQSLPPILRRAFLEGDFSIMDSDDEWQLIPGIWVDMAVERGRSAQPGMITSLGIDIARSGEDETVIAERRGNDVTAIHVYPGAETPDGATVCAKMKPLMANNPIACIDVIGVGSSPYDMARGIWGDRIKGVNVASGSSARTQNGNFRFANYKSELFWHFMERLNPDHPEPISLPDDGQMMADLKAIRWEMSGDKIKIESKDKMKQRIGRSPDRGEAVIYSFHTDLMSSFDLSSLIIGG